MQQPSRLEATEQAVNSDGILLLPPAGPAASSSSASTFKTCVCARAVLLAPATALPPLARTRRSDALALAKRAIQAPMSGHRGGVCERTTRQPTKVHQNEGQNEGYREREREREKEQDE